MSDQQNLRLGIQDVIYRYVDAAEQYRQRLYPARRPEPGSQASQEMADLNCQLADVWSSEPVALAYGAAELHMRAATDQLVGLAVVFGTNLEDSLMTVGRGTTESSARAAWLLTPTDGRQRVARCMTERLAGLYQEARLNAQLNRDLDTAARIREIEESAVRHGFTVVNQRRRKHVGSEPYPGATQAVRQVFGHLGEDMGVRAYADLSAVAHSTLAAFAVKKSPILSTVGVDAPSMEPPIERAAVIALTAYDQAFRSYVLLFGWDPNPWDLFTREAHARLRRLFGAPFSGIDIIRLSNRQ